MCKRIITIIFALATVCGGASAQQKQGHARIPISRDTGKGPTSRWRRSKT